MRTASPCTVLRDLPLLLKFASAPQFRFPCRTSLVDLLARSSFPHDLLDSLSLRQSDLLGGSRRKTRRPIAFSSAVLAHILRLPPASTTPPGNRLWTLTLRSTALVTSRDLLGQKLDDSFKRSTRSKGSMGRSILRYRSTSSGPE